MTFALALAAGMVAQIAARHLRLPGIVLLLLVGVVLGPDVANLVRPDTLGEGLRVIVGAAVALILFEGGMQLEADRLRHEAPTIRRLIVLGAGVTAIGGALAGRYVMGWSWTVAIPFGTLVTVTGPTVIGPLLRRIRVNRTLHTILEAEGVLIDPIGAILAVVALEIVLGQEMGAAARGLLGIPTRLVFGAVAGAAGGFVLARVLGSRRVVPHGLENVFTLAAVLLLYAACEAVLSESGIMAAPVAGVVVVNSSAHRSGDLKEFKEQLSVLLVGLLFILLAADVRIAEVTALGMRGVVTVLLLMAVLRPAAVWAGTAGSPLTLREKAFLSWMGPRGIVAAAVASLFAEELIHAGQADGSELRALVFLVIAATVFIEGLGGGLVAGWLGVRRRSDTGFMIAGAGPVARALGMALHNAGEEVVLVDTDRGQVAWARAAGLSATEGDVLEEEVLEELDLAGRRGLVCLIPNEGVGLSVAEKARREFRVGRTDIAVRPGRSSVVRDGLGRLGGRILFAAETDLEYWGSEIGRGRATLERVRYAGAAEVLAPDLAGRAEGLLLLVHEHRGRSLPVNDAARVRPGDTLTVLSVVGAQLALAELAPLEG